MHGITNAYFKVRENVSGRMEKVIRGSMLTIKRMAMESSLGQMGKDMKDIGRMANNMEMV